MSTMTHRPAALVEWMRRVERHRGDRLTAACRARPLALVQI
ncbi:hypothetical protein [Cryobacterium sp. Y57]|nr:hypothetical protein [Cryobacterium sp. Y57]